MPPPTRNNQFGNYGPVLASLWQVLSLIVNLLYLKLLDGIDLVCVCTGPHPCLARAINKTEERIIYHFLTMIPDSSYKPRVRVTRHIYYPDRVEEIVGNCEPNQTPVLQSSTANNQNGARNSANLSRSWKSRLVSRPLFACLRAFRTGLTFLRRIMCRRILELSIRCSRLQAVADRIIR